MRSALLALLLPFSIAATPVARVLTEDPPLPGQPLDGWEALDPTARPAATLGPDEAVALALAAHPELQALRAGVDAARGAALDARALPNPTWELEFSPAGAGFTGLGLELELSEALHAQLAGAAARPAVDAARLRLEEATLRLTYETKAAYYAHQAALAAWGAALRAVDAFAAARDAQRAMRAAGNAPALDEVRKDLAYEAARIRAAELEVEVISTREALARLLRQDPGPLPPAALPPLGRLAGAEEIAAARSLALRALDAEIRAAELNLTATRVGALTPQLGLTFGAEPHGPGWETSVGVELQAPAFSFGRGAALSASAERDRLIAERARLEIEVRSAARTLSQQLESAHRRARHYEEVLLPAQRRALEETLLNYNAMQLGLDALLDAWRAGIDAEVGYAETLREALTAQAALEALLGGARVSGPSAPSSTPRSTSQNEAH